MPRCTRASPQEISEDEKLASIDKGFFTEDFDPIPAALEDAPANLTLEDQVREKCLALLGSRAPTPASLVLACSRFFPPVHVCVRDARQMNVLESKLSVVNKRLSQRVLQNYTRFLQGMQNIHDIKSDLTFSGTGTARSCAAFGSEMLLRAVPSSLFLR